MKLTKKQQIFIDKLLLLIKQNNLCSQYKQTFLKKIMLEELLCSINNIYKFNYKLCMSCYQNNAGYMRNNIMFSSNLFNNDLINELKILFNVGQLDNNSQNISYVLSVLQKIKINCDFIGIINNKSNRIMPKYLIKYKMEYATSIFGFYTDSYESVNDL
jgi:hypothetical protein